MPVYQIEVEKVGRSKPMMISQAEAEHNLEKAQKSMLKPVIESIKTIKESKNSLMKVKALTRGMWHFADKLNMQRSMSISVLLLRSMPIVLAKIFSNQLPK